MAKKVAEVKTKKAVAFTVLCGGQPLRTVYDDRELAESLARDKKRDLIRLGNDVSLPEFEVELESKEVEIPA